MEEEELKKEIVNILNIYGKEIEEVNRLRDVEPHDNPIYLYLEAQARLEGFKAGQLAEREKCLKMIEELYEKELKEYRVESDGTLTEESGIALGSMMCFKDKLKVELTKKVSEVGE